MVGILLVIKLFINTADEFYGNDLKVICPQKEPRLLRIGITKEKVMKQSQVIFSDMLFFFLIFRKHVSVKIMSQLLKKCISKIFVQQNTIISSLLTPRS